MLANMSTIAVSNYILTVSVSKVYLFSEREKPKLSSTSTFLKLGQPDRFRNSSFLNAKNELGLTIGFGGVCCEGM